ncbi:hypothetical protein K438DRAFT_1769621 [Mycena galopus ATCC 62051]|nr:hypothetical protein K438DRAFT_1769621 [Mycena galopus ATCC 62051]
MESWSPDDLRWVIGPKNIESHTTEAIDGSFEESSVTSPWNGKRTPKDRFNAVSCLRIAHSREMEPSNGRTLVLSCICPSLHMRALLDSARRSTSPRNPICGIKDPKTTHGSNGFEQSSCSGPLKASNRTLFPCYTKSPWRSEPPVETIEWPLEAEEPHVKVEVRYRSPKNDAHEPKQERRLGDRRIDGVPQTDKRQELNAIQDYTFFGLSFGPTTF